MRLVVFFLIRFIVLLMQNISVISSTEKTSNLNHENFTKGYFTNNISNYQVVIPRKVSSDGQLVSNYLPHFHNIDLPINRNSREIFSDNDPVHYHVPINGKKLKVRLTPNPSPFPSSMLIEHQTPETELNIGKTRLRRPEKQNCHFKGKIVDDPESLVALSTCNGLAGFIQSKEGDYFIEPIRGSKPGDGDHPHIVYKKRDDGSKFKDKNCMIKGKDKKLKNSRGEMKEGENSALKKEMPTLKFNKKNSVESFHKNKKNGKNCRKVKNKDNESMSREIEEDDEIESSVSFIPSQEIKQNLADKITKTKNFLKGRDNYDSFEDIIEYKKKKFGDINATLKKSIEPIDHNLLNSKGNQFRKKSLDKSKKKCCHTKKKDDKQKKKMKQGKCSDSCSSFFDGKNSTNLNDYSFNRYKNYSNYVKAIKKPDNKFFDKSEFGGSDDVEFHKKDSKKLFNLSNTDSSGLSEWDSVIKSMKDEHWKNEIDSKGTNYKELNHVSRDNVKHFHKTNVNQNARSVLKKVKNKTAKKIQDSPKHTDESDHQIYDGKIKNDILFYDKENKNSHNNYNETQYSDNYLYLDRNIRSLNHFKEDSRNITEEMKMKRAIQYKSCRPQPGCRNKSECSWDLRMLIVISYEFSQHHKDTDLETYILTIVNMVSTNFHDASLGILLNVKLVRMVFIEYKLDELDEGKNSLEQLFENFCVFQYRINPHKMDHPNHHDIAVYVVSFKGCIGDQVFGVTNVGSVCHGKEACIVSRDEGLLLGNIITHQVGHSLGADHDDGGQGSCQPFEPDGSVYYHMSPMITLNSTQWSRCSSEAIQRFLRNQGSRCLEYLSTELDFDWPDILPGQIYNPVQQCALNYHMKTLPCYTGDFCKFLYCQATTKECVSLLVPPADGTSCASGMWCVRGSCVRKGRHPGMVNGEWSNWGIWSPCSRTCSGGVQHSFRLCNNPPPALGGRYCVGKRLRYRICNSDTSCDRFTASFREWQCKMTDHVPFRGKFYTWKAFHNHFEYIECALLCESQTGIVAIRELVALDGTPCKPGTKNVCIQGKCIDVGCDWEINSGAVRDACGVCHGNGTECRVIQGIYDEKNGTAYVPFLKIPKGSGMIYAREINPSSVKLVVASYNTDYFYLNGPAESLETRPAEYDFGNIKGVYSIRGGMERIFISGPTQEDLVFYVKFVDNELNPGVRYQFAIPEVDKMYVPTYSWQFLDWDLCSDACGGGQQKATAKCVEDQAGIVDGKYCLTREKPNDIIRSCNEFPCLPRWWVGAWTDCVEIGNEKVRYRSVLCMRTRDPNSLRNEILKDKYCCDEEKPDSVRRCNETVEAKDHEQCSEPKDKCDLPSIYNLKDAQGHFSDLSLKDFKKQFADEPDEEAEDADNILMFAEGDFDSPIIHRDNVVMKINDDAKGKFLIKRQPDKILTKPVKKPFTDIKDLTTKLPVNKENIKIELSEDWKKKHGKNRLHHQPSLKEESSLILNMNDRDVFSPDKKMALRNLTEKNPKIESAVLESTGSSLIKMIQKEVNNQAKDKDNNDKFGGTTCPSYASRYSKKFPPLHLPTETTCTKKCTTCAVLLQFTIPNSDFLTLRPPCPAIDQLIIPEFTLSIIPIVCEEVLSTPTDMYFEIFHESGSWPHGLEGNKTLIKGQRALFYLHEIRENITRQPFVFHAEN